MFKLPVYAAGFSLAISILSLAFSIYTNQVSLRLQSSRLQDQLDQAVSSLEELKNQDQYLINQQLRQDITATKEVYKKSLGLYEKLLDHSPNSQLSAWEKSFAAILNDLSVVNYASAESKLTQLNKDIDLAAAAAQTKTGIDLASLAVSQTPPQNGYQRQKVTVNNQEFAVDILAADLNSTKVLVDTASDSTCANDCPVLSLAAYAARNNAFAAINGSYFCPASYPSCAGKTNSFDLLLMNKNKVYFNSDNNVYSTNPAVVFNGSSVRFLSRAMDWGRDTSIDSMLSNYPLLVLNGASQFGGDSDPKKSSAGSRPFVASKGSTVYIGVVRNVSVAQAALVLQTLGMEHALNLDSGGSTAFWVNGSYKAGPGRDIPNAIVFVRK